MAIPRPSTGGDAKIEKVGHTAGSKGGNTPFAKDPKATTPKPLSAK